MPSLLRDKIAARVPGICLYGFAPPKRTTTTDELAAIVAQTEERLAPLAPDGLIVYDIQDEAERVTEPRPFPFLPTLDPDDYAHTALAGLPMPKIVYRSVGRDTPESLRAWLAGGPGGGRVSVLVGAPSQRASGLPLADAYTLAREIPDLTLGGIAIAERHARRLDEHERILAKQAAGCRFFVTQAVYDVTSTKSLLSDYALATRARNVPPVPIILTFSPCGSERTLAFMKWLGISFPRWLENDLRFSPNPLATSVALAERIFAEVWDYARGKGIPLGVNVESVSIRKVEIEASIDLFSRLRALMHA